MSRERVGVLLCLLSAAGFSTSALLGRIALDAGASVLTILALRYAGATAIFGGLVWASGQPLPPRSTLLGVLALGAGVLSLQAALFYAALTRIDAALATLLLYACPAMVAVVSIALGREPPSARRAVAVLVATVGVGLVVAGDVVAGDALAGDAAAGGLGRRADPRGVGLALASAGGYAGYLLISHRVVGGTPALVVSALVSAGAAASLWTVGLLAGAVGLGVAPAGWGAILGTILLSTVLAISTLQAGVARVGPTAASVLSTAEVPLAVTWALLLLGERLQPVQLLGGVLIVAAVLLLQVRAIRLRRRPTVGSVPRGAPSQG